MKQTLLAILLLATVQAGASDWLTRVGGGSGGGPQDPSAKAIAATESAPVAIRPASISAAEMKKLFSDQIVFMYALTEHGMAVQIQRYRHDGGATWRRDPIEQRPSRVHIRQHVEGKLYLAGFGDGAASMAIELDGGPYADDAIVTRYIADTGRVYNYATVLGANRGVRIMQVVPDPVRDTITYDDFVAAIKRNGTFDVLRDMPLPCPGCQGNGFTKSDGSDGRLAVRNICPACKGKKTTTKPLLCRISL